MPSTLLSTLVLVLIACATGASSASAVPTTITCRPPQSISGWQRQTIAIDVTGSCTDSGGLPIIFGTPQVTTNPGNSPATNATGTVTGSNGSYTFTPGSDWFFGVNNVTIPVSDSNGATSNLTLSVGVKQNVYDPPCKPAVSYVADGPAVITGSFECSLLASGPVTFRYGGPTPDPMDLVNKAAGKLAVAADGKFTYQPPKHPGPGIEYGNYIVQVSDRGSEHPMNISIPVLGIGAEMIRTSAVKAQIDDVVKDMPTRAAICHGLCTIALQWTVSSSTARALGLKTKGAAPVVIGLRPALPLKSGCAGDETICDRVDAQTRFVPQTIVIPAATKKALNKAKKPVTVVEKATVRTREGSKVTVRKVVLTP